MRRKSARLAEKQGNVQEQPRDDKAPASPTRQVPSFYRFKSSDHDDIDPTIQFFYHPRTITVLVLMLCFFLYVALYTTTGMDTVQNTKIGVSVCVVVLLLIGLLQFEDGPFIRPHPAFWRLVTAMSVVYQLFLVFLLFQNVQDARSLFKFIDPSLGVALPERSYGEHCELKWNNIVAHMDIFVVAHSLGWFAKAFIVRDYWFLWILSVMFEVMEYTLQHHLPNFAECWWDHWILDVLICNWIGLYFGMKTCEYFKLRHYCWRGVYEIKTYGGKFSRAVQQFTPHTWTDFRWEATHNFKHFVAVVLLQFLFLTGEINAFYLKYLLWIPPESNLNVYRLALMFFFAVRAVREFYQYLTDKDCKRLGPQAWMCIANVSTETLIIVKFGKDEFHEPTPTPVIYFWIAFIACLVGYACKQFFLPSLLKSKKQ